RERFPWAPLQPLPLLLRKLVAKKKIANVQSSVFSSPTVANRRLVTKALPQAVAHLAFILHM
ncbi:MAG: hypothetical protein ABWX58_10185, partial [Psychrobacillus psychrotolerans]